MTSPLWLITGGLLICAGLTALILQRALMRKLLAFNVMGSGIFLVLLALAPRSVDGTADPIAQALLLTGILITIAATALGLLLTRQYFLATGRSELPADEQVGTDD